MVSPRGIVNYLTWMQRDLPLEPDRTASSVHRERYLRVSVWELFWPLPDGGRACWRDRRASATRPRWPSWSARRG